MVIFPFRSHPAVDFRSAPFPMEIFAVAVAPQRINVHNRKGTVALIGNLNFSYCTLIMDQGVSRTQILPNLFPTRASNRPSTSTHFIGS
ncbi:MAG: hypothetical protein DMG76_06960 [Acidobacteria bacterium]|jgi:hypothetical protein|nr:MAG: hypothetical protein DMG76_06960 [Acidobacteriota bacterium]